MKIDVELYVAGQTFTETVNAVNYQEAKRVALARNPNARVISVNANFHDDNNNNNSSSFFSSSNDNVDTPSSSSDMDFGSFLGLCILGGGIWAFVMYTPIVFLGGAAAIGGGIGNLMPKHKLLTGTILALIFGLIGYGYGEKLQDNWTYNTTEIEQVYDI